jgi:c-di-GMP-binding flagellar brake protein YcgR
VCLDEDGVPVEEGMGATRNISQSGALLETSRQITSKYIMLITIDLEKNIMETKAEVVHSRQEESGKYLTGIQFIGSSEDIKKMIKNFIIDYHRRKASNA